MTALLASFYEPCRFKPALDLAEGKGLSRANLNLDGARNWRSHGLRRLEMQFQRLLKICQGLLFGLALAGDIDFKTLR
jgi:hypothetical protein